MKELIIALDNIGKKQAFEIASNLSGQVWGFKINDLVLEYGFDIIKSFQNYGNIFLDLKLFDTPNTVFDIVSRIADYGVNIVTVHASGGEEMLKSALRAAKNEGKTTIAAITTLTSMPNESIRQIYRGFPTQRFVELLKKVDINTVICSGDENELYQALQFKTICSGFRPFGSLPNDEEKRPTGIVNSNYLIVEKIKTINELEKIKEKINAY